MEINLNVLETTQYFIDEMPFESVFSVQTYKLKEIDFNMIYKKTGYILQSIDVKGKSAEITFFKN